MKDFFYKEQDRFLVAVDCIVLGFKEGEIFSLISKRNIEPQKGQNSLMGGFLWASENLSDAVQRVLFEYTGIEGMYMEQVGVYGKLDRDEGERVLSVAYYALINIEDFDENLCEIHQMKWVEVNKIGKLIFDHNEMLEDTLHRLRRKAAAQPIGFNLLPDKFTLPQLQQLYESIYQTNLDKRNFRKKILEMDILKKLEEKDKSNSKKGAYFYMFDLEKYTALLNKGFYFSL